MEAENSILWLAAGSLWKLAELFGTSLRNSIMLRLPGSTMGPSRMHKARPFGSLPLAPVWHWQGIQPAA